MNSLIRVLFLTPVYQGMRRRYHLYMQQGCTVLTAFLTTLALPLCWIFLRFESPSWQRVIQNRTYWFPQISPIRPRLGDGLRYLLQGLWLLLTYPESRNEKRHQPAAAGKKWVKHKRQGYIRWLGNIPERFELQRLEQSLITRLTPTSKRTRRVMFIILGIFTGILALLCISQPFGMMAQFVFVLLLWALAMVMRRVPGRLPTLMLIVLSLTVSCRYLWWRYTETLNWDDPVSLVCGLLLLFAETYAWVVLVLGYFQTIWPLNRQPVAMPDDINSWPTIDLMVPTYNEDLGVVKPTIYAALGIDWPKDKINIYILDDGNRPAFKAFAAEVGVHYIARPTHEHAKAGNINHALKQAHGEFVAIFDCDHVPTRSFLQLTLGWFFKDTKLGILQTPHHFFSPDPFERNLGRFRQTPNEGTLFYGLVQDGNDMWDATFFCGSSVVLVRCCAAVR
ncbi:cellulose synthase catalytic subunit [Yersinia intermedia]|nr:cellulose synthase catalytic subunit [Yersinia intermedia]